MIKATDPRQYHGGLTIEEDMRRIAEGMVRRQALADLAVYDVRSALPARRTPWWEPGAVYVYRRAVPAAVAAYVGVLAAIWALTYTAMRMAEVAR